MSSAQKLVVTQSHGIKRITINRPARRNAVDVETMDLLLEAFAQAGQDESRVVVLTGAGDAFCAGADLAAVNAMEIQSFDVTASLREKTNPLVLQMRTLAKPVIARVHGVAVGVGFNYALACDIIIASEGASFAQLFIKIGLMPDGGGTYFLPRLVGYHKAFELMATGDELSASDALALGIINRVVPLQELDAEVDNLAARLARSPAVALAKIKAGLNYSGHGEPAELAAALDWEAVNQADCFHSPDFREGVTAFVEKRRAIFGKASDDSAARR